MPSAFDLQAFPRRQAPHRAAPVCGLIPNLTARPGNTLRPLILLVDDNLDARTMYGSCLEFAGFACMTARHGQEAIERIRERRPALILMDASMPGMDGWEATRRIKADPQTHDIPLYMLTAHAFAEHRQHAIEVGADGFLAKPILPDALVREVRLALNLPESPVGKLS
jgi:two-component system cell cycle response regulator DivK